MQITEQTSAILKLQTKKKFSRFSILLNSLLSILFLLAGLVVMITPRQQITLKCKKIEPTQVTCELTSSMPLLGEETTLIRQLQGAEIKVSEDSDGDSIYQLVLVTKNNNIPLTGAYYIDKADQINAFINNPEGISLSLNIHQDYSWLNFLSGKLFAFAGIGTIILSLMYKMQTSCIFDKGSDRMCLKQHNFFKSETIERMLHEIKEARVIEETNDDGYNSINGYGFYNIELILFSGEKITLQISIYESSKRHIAKSINQFLRLKS